MRLYCNIRTFEIRYYDQKGLEKYRNDSGQIGNL